MCVFDFEAVSQEMRQKSERERKKFTTLSTNCEITQTNTRDGPMRLIKCQDWSNPSAGMEVERISVAAGALSHCWSTR